MLSVLKLCQLVTCLEILTKLNKNHSSTVRLFQIVCVFVSHFVVVKLKYILNNQKTLVILPFCQTFVPFL